MQSCVVSCWTRLCEHRKSSSRLNIPLDTDQSFPTFGFGDGDDDDGDNDADDEEEEK